MNSMDCIASALAPRLKAMGYRKNRLTRYKNREEISLVFAIQKSQFTDDVWYYNFGICIKEIAKGSPTSISGCQICFRMERKVNGVSLTEEHLVNLLNSWQEKYGHLRQLRICAIEGKLPGIESRDVIRYLTTVDASGL